ncbi:MAG: response regulator [Gemmobacter sp.]|nr:response regulator [Gemmobacter sp.]
MTFSIVNRKWPTDMGAMLGGRKTDSSTIWHRHPPTAQRTPRAGASLLQDKRVLVADDNRTNRYLLRLLMGRAGAEVTEVEDGAQALEAWVPGRFDILLFDIMMPNMSGVDALRAIRQRSVARTFKEVAVAVTTDFTPASLETYRLAGFDACAYKPVSPGDFIALLEDVCTCRPNH